MSRLFFCKIPVTYLVSNEKSKILKPEFAGVKDCKSREPFVFLESELTLLYYTRMSV